MIEYTAESVAALNACTRYIIVTVLRNAHGDATNGGVSSRHASLYMPHPDGFLDGDQIDRDRLLRILPPAFPGCPLRVAPWDAQRTMAGGNFVYGDGRFRTLYGAPLSVHDRVE